MSRTKNRPVVSIAARFLTAAIMLFIFSHVAGGSSPAIKSEAVTGSADLTTKIGQMIMVGFRCLSVTADSPVIRDIRDNRIGGVILFDYDVPTHSPRRNIASSGQVKHLTESLQAAAAIPLFIAVDQEGGRVCRLKASHGFPPTPSQAELGRQNDPTVTRRTASVTADTLAAAGITVNFAPVVDLNVNPDNPVIGKLARSFSADPDIVVRHAAIMIDAFHSRNLAAAVKHFPGHGSSTADSHEGFVDVTRTWTRRELVPFARLIDSNRCDMVMTAHVVNRNLDRRYPATLSRATLTTLLRGEMGFSGVIISDDMQMKAIRSHYELADAVKRAVDAGIDILLFANNTIFDEVIATRVVSLITAMVNAGDIAEERIDASYRRIMNVKTRLYHP